MNLIATLIGWGVPAKLAKPLLIGGTVLLLCLAIFAAVKMHDRSVIRTHDAVQQQKAAKAVDQAATERATDTINQAKTEQEAHDAIQAQPDQPIAPTTRALSCERLRRIGRAPPACR